MAYGINTNTVHSHELDIYFKKFTFWSVYIIVPIK
jgi:hypothetical protein